MAIFFSYFNSNSDPLQLSACIASNNKPVNCNVFLLFFWKRNSFDSIKNKRTNERRTFLTYNVTYFGFWRPGGLHSGRNTILDPLILLLIGLLLVKLLNWALIKAQTNKYTDFLFFLIKFVGTQLYTN